LLLASLFQFRLRQYRLDLLDGVVGTILGIQFGAQSLYVQCHAVTVGHRFIPFEQCGSFGGHVTARKCQFPPGA